MKSDMEYDVKRKLLTVHIGKSATSLDMYGRFIKLMNNREWIDGSSMLYICDKIEELNLYSEDLRLTVKLINKMKERFKNTRAAMVVKDAIIHKLCESIKNVMNKNTDMVVEIFEEKGRAIEWLEQGRLQKVIK
jgi:hypothetical protein